MNDRGIEIELEMEEDGRWIAEFGKLPGVLAYGATKEEARGKVVALAEAVMVEHSPGGRGIAE